MTITSDIKKEAKHKYSKDIYKLFKKYIMKKNSFENKESLFNYLNALEGYSKEELIDCFKLYQEEPIAVPLLIENNIALNQLEYYIKTFGRSIILNYPNVVVELNLEQQNIKKLLPYIHNNSELLHKIRFNESFITDSRSNDVPGEYIANNFDKYIEILKDNPEFTSSEIKEVCTYDEKTHQKFSSIKNIKAYLDINAITAICSLEDETFKKFQELNSLFQLKDASYESKYKTIAFNFFIANPQYLDDFIKTIKENPHTSIMQAIRDQNNHQLTENLFYFFVNNEMDFYEKKQYLAVNLFSSDIYKTNLEDMIDNREKGVMSYPEEVNSYLDSYQKLNNCTLEKDLVDFYQNYKNSNIISAKEMREYIITEYNKYINSLLTKTEDLEQNPNVTITEVEYVSKIYTDENGEPKKGKVKIYTLHNVPYQILMHAMSAKDSSGLTKEQQELSQEIYKNPDKWQKKEGYGTNYISMSLNKDDGIGLFGVPEVVAGFNNIHNDHQIKYTKTFDAGTIMENNATIPNTNILLQPEILSELASNSLLADAPVEYNEVVSSRAGIIPDCMTSATTPNGAHIPVLNDHTLEWALYYDIPIFNLDCLSYYKPLHEKFIKYYNELKNSDRIPNQQEIYYLFKLLHDANKYIPYPKENGYDILSSLANTSNKNLTDQDIYNLNWLQIQLTSIQSSIEGYNFDVRKQDDYEKAVEILNNRKKELDNLNAIVANLNNTIYEKQKIA